MVRTRPHGPMKAADITRAHNGERVRIELVEFAPRLHLHYHRSTLVLESGKTAGTGAVLSPSTPRALAKRKTSRQPRGWTLTRYPRLPLPRRYLPRICKTSKGHITLEVRTKAGCSGKQLLSRRPGWLRTCFEKPSGE